jgi:hypothetical protein
MKNTRGDFRCHLVRSVVLFCIFLTACSAGVGNSIPPAPTPWIPTQVQVTPGALSFDEQLAVLEVSDPASPTYDPNSSAYAQFPDAVQQIAAMNSSMNNGASMLAYALGFPRPDSVLAAQALISLGPEITATDLPTFIAYLKDPRPAVRMYASIALSITGKDGSCSLGDVGPLLWDSDPNVRSAAALAIQGITGKKLEVPPYQITWGDYSANPVTPDTPEETIVAPVRSWWENKGSKVNWHPHYDLCDP